LKRNSRLPPVIRYVYVIGPVSGLQKIGMATDPRARLATLQTASPLDLMIHVAIAVPFGDAPDVEHQAHRLLGKMCVRNEWFEATPAEALFAIYTAALPWMERRTMSGPQVIRATGFGPGLPAAAASTPVKWPPYGVQSADLLPLFQPRGPDRTTSCDD
jgi:hypothetical protein